MQILQLVDLFVTLGTVVADGNNNIFARNHPTGTLGHVSWVMCIMYRTIYPL